MTIIWEQVNSARLVEFETCHAKDGNPFKPRRRLALLFIYFDFQGINEAIARARAYQKNCSSLWSLPFFFQLKIFTCLDMKAFLPCTFVLIIFLFFPLPL